MTASLIPMADPSLNNNSTVSTFTCNPLKGEEEMVVVKESKLRPRRLVKDLPKIEEVGSKYKEIILTLEKDKGWPTSVMRNYKGFWMMEEILPSVLAMEEAFQPRSSDLIVASYVKSGTTWLKALTFIIIHRNKYAFSSHPLLKLNPHDCVPFIEIHYGSNRDDEQYLETLPSPRVLGTHLPYSVLPESITTSKCRIVYICREPKDVLVSLWQMVTRFEWIKKSFPLNQVFNLFCEGRIPGGSIWDHVLEYYMKSLHQPDKILFLKYEAMMKDPIDNVMRLANFVGCPFSEEEVKNGLVEEIVRFCSFNKLKDLDVNKNGIDNVRNDIFFRKAVVGDWQNHLTPEMSTELDEITKEKLGHSGFTYGAASIGVRIRSSTLP